MERYLHLQLNSTFNELTPVIKEDKAYQKIKVIEEHDRAMYLLGSLYIRYIKVANALTEIHNYLINPLKRQALKNVLEKIFGRILELKHEMVDLDKSDFQYLDTIIFLNDLSRNHTQLSIPSYYKDKREDLISVINERIDKAIYKREHPEEFVVAEEESPEESVETRRTRMMSRGGSIGSTTRQRTITLREPSLRISEERLRGTSVNLASFRGRSSRLARRPKGPPKIISLFEFDKEIRLIQKHHRARTGRLLGLKRVLERKAREDKINMREKIIPPDVAHASAKIIQDKYMSYKIRCWKNYVNTQLGLTYGTLMPSYRDTSFTKEIKVITDKRKQLQKQLVADLEFKEMMIMDDLKNKRRSEIMEDMLTELRAFIRMWYDYTKNYGYTEVPEWPTDEEITPTRVVGLPEGLPWTYIEKNFPEVDLKLGTEVDATFAGSELMTAGYWVPVEKYVVAAELARSLLAVGVPVEVKKKQEEKDAEKEREEMKKEEERLKLEELMKRGHVPFKSECLKDVTTLAGAFRVGWDIDNTYKENQADEIMNELIKIEATYKIMKEIRKDADEQMRKELKILKTAIAKDNDHREEAKKQKKKKKKGKKKKKRGKKEPLSHLTNESVLDDLAEEGLVIKVDPVNIDQLPSQYNLHGQEMSANFEYPIPAMGDVYQVAKEYIALPLLSDEVKEYSPPIKSVLLAGSNRLTRSLVHGLANSVGAVILYLPALNFTKKWKKKMLINMLMKVARGYQPSIFYIDGAEKPYYKKAPKNERKMKPGTLKKIIPKLVKGIKKTDRIVVLGGAEKPWLSKAKLTKVFQKVLVCPESDYHTVSALVQGTIMKYHGVDRVFDTSIPSFMFMGRPLDEVEQRLTSIFTTERRIKLYYQPITLEETGCIEKEPNKETSLEDWYRKRCPINKAKKKLNEIEKAKVEKMAKMNVIKDVENRRTLVLPK